MSLKDKGFRFCVSPNKSEARWLHPIEYKTLYPDWVDVTAETAEKLLEFLLEDVDNSKL